MDSIIYLLYSSGSSELSLYKKAKDLFFFDVLHGFRHNIALSIDGALYQIIGNAEYAKRFPNGGMHPYEVIKRDLPDLMQVCRVGEITITDPTVSNDDVRWLFDTLIRNLS